MTYEEMKTRPGGISDETSQPKSAEISTDIGVRPPDDNGLDGVNGSRTDSKIDKPQTRGRSPAVQGSVYFIRMGTKVKIGFSTRPLDRLRTLQTSHPGTLEIIGTMKGTYALEAKLHASFHRYLVRREWFELSKDIVRYIEANTLEGQARAAIKREAYLTPQEPRQHRTADAAVAELRRHLKMRHMTAAPVLRPFLSNLEQQLKSWDAGGNREHLRPAIERTILQIEAARQ